jgi:hypothetical protein
MRLRRSAHGTVVVLRESGCTLEQVRNLCQAAVNGEIEVIDRSD